MPTDQSVIFLEAMSFEYMHGTAPKISIMATVQRDGSFKGAHVCCLQLSACAVTSLHTQNAHLPAVEVNRRPYGWRSLEMLEVTMDQGWLFGADWPGLPRQVRIS